VKLVQVAGYLGSGKTTFIISLGRSLSDIGSKVAILVNEVGEIPVDGKVIQDYGLTVKDIGGGCICCQVVGNLTKTLKLMSVGPNPDIIIIEPTGIAVPSSIIDTVKRLNVDVGPTIVLFDTTRSQKLLTYDTLKRLISTQLKDADIIALSKIDAVSEDVVTSSGEAVSQINPSAQLLRLSTRRGDGVMTLVKAIQEMVIEV
jgi:G3E family GTPase